LAHPSGRSASHAPETVRAPVRSDRFKVWWTETQDVLPDDFEIGAWRLHCRRQSLPNSAHRA